MQINKKFGTSRGQNLLPKLSALMLWASCL